MEDPPAHQFIILGAQKCGTTALWVRPAAANNPPNAVSVTAASALMLPR